MSVKIRLTRIGRHKDPFYRIVAADSRYARDGRYIEQIGYTGCARWLGRCLVYVYGKCGQFACCGRTAART